MTWREYEQVVYEYFSSRFPNASLKKNVKLQVRGSESLREREIDILIESEIFGHSIQIAIECKNWSSKLDVADVGSFIDKLKDVGISKGVMISKIGFSAGAKERALKELEVQLQTIDFENIPEYHGFYGNPYRGNFGALISAPNGWLVNADIDPSHRKDMSCYLHPFEYKSDEASRKREFMYFQVFPILNDRNLEATLKEQDLVVRNSEPNPQIRYWNENLKGRNTLYREIKYSEKGFTEITAGVEHEEFFVYCVSVMKNNYIPDDLARLRFIINNSHLIHLLGVDPENAHESWNQFFNRY